MVELFAVELLTPEAAARVPADPACRWVAEREVRSGRAADGRAVRETVERLLVRGGESLA